MATPGFSLVGFLDKRKALDHFRTACKVNDDSDGALVAEWEKARSKLGAPFAKAGQPEILPIPAAFQDHIKELSQQAWPGAVFPEIKQSTFQMVEIDPLLSFQYTIDIGHADHRFVSCSQPPSMAELLPICLPIKQPTETFVASRVETSSSSVIMKSRNLGLQIKEFGLFDMNIAGLNINIAGIKFHRGLPLTHVVRYNGRHYLYNGFHRAVGARRKGATHLPCVVRDVNTAEDAGMRRDAPRFLSDVLESDNPPTLGHFTHGRAYEVALLSRSRILHVTWSQYIMNDE